MLRPTGTRVLVEQLEAKDVTEGGIIIPDDAKERPPEGMVVAVGPDCCMLSEGQHVIFRKWSSKSWMVEDDGQELIVMEESEALAVRE